MLSAAPLGPPPRAHRACGAPRSGSMAGRLQKTPHLPAGPGRLPVTVRGSRGAFRARSLGATGTLTSEKKSHPLAAGPQASSPVPGVRQLTPDGLGKSPVEAAHLGTCQLGFKRQFQPTTRKNLLPAEDSVFHTVFILSTALGVISLENYPACTLEPSGF